jgi:hypothetical protein
MEIQGPKIDVLPQTKSSIDSLIRDFKVGQILRAVAQSTSAQGLVQLAIGRLTVQASSILPLPPGTQLTLRVEQTGEQPGFRVLAPLPPEAVKAAALRQVLPRMLELAPTLERALQSSTSPKGAEPLPPDIRQLAQAVARVIPSAADTLSGSGLQKTIGRSGLFSEAQMARGRLPEADVKVALARLATRLRNMTQASGSSPAKTATSPEATVTQRQPPTGSSSPANPTPMDGKLPANLRAATASSSQPSPEGGGPNAGKTLQGSPGTPPAIAPATSRSPVEGKASLRSEGNPVPARTDAGLSGGKPPVPGIPPEGNLPAPGRPQSTALPPMRSGLPPTPLQAGHPQNQAAPRPLTGNAPQEAVPVQPFVDGKAAPLQSLTGKPMTGGQAQTAPSAVPTTEPVTTRWVRELATQVEGALSRIQYNQLNSLPGEDPNRQAWQLDLPFRNGEHLGALRLRIQEEKHAKALAHEGSTWRVDLAFELEPLGPIRVRIGLQGETVSSIFWAEKPETVDLLERRMRELEQGLERVGLDIGRLSAHRGRPPAEQEPDSPPEAGLLNEQA